MSDLFWLSSAQMRRIEPYFPLSHGVARVDDRRVISRIIFVISQWVAMARRAQGLRPAQDDLQPLRPLEPSSLHPDIRRAGGEGLQARAADDRRDPSQSPSYGGQSAQKGAVPRPIGRTKGGLFAISSRMSGAT